MSPGWTDVRHTTGARAALLLLVAFGTISLAVFAAGYLRSTGFLLERINEWLRYESAQMADLPPADLRRAVDRHPVVDTAQRWRITLFGPGGERLAGDKQELPPDAPGQPFDYDDVRGTAEKAMPMRGLVTLLPDGTRLLVGERLNWVGLLDRSALQGLALGALGAVLLGLVTAAGFGIASLRRLGTMRLATEAIVRGELGRRLPEGSPQTDLGRLARLVNGMLDDIQRLMHEVQTVSDGIAHDLRTPLTRLLGVLERTARRARTAEAYAAGLDEATEETHRLLSMLQGLLRLSEIEHDNRRTGFTEVRLEEVAADVVDLMEPLAEENGIRLAVAGGTATMQADPSLLFEAVTNLVDNAVKFTPPGGTITVTVLDHERPGLRVSDTGPGIPPEEREQVLQRFYRVEKSRHTEGNGLGLSMVKAIADLHGLRIRIGDAGPGCVVDLVMDDAAVPRRLRG